MKLRAVLCVTQRQPAIHGREARIADALDHLGIICRQEFEDDGSSCGRTAAAAAPGKEGAGQGETLRHPDLLFSFSRRTMTQASRVARAARRAAHPLLWFHDMQVESLPDFVGEMAQWDQADINLFGQVDRVLVNRPDVAETIQDRLNLPVAPFLLGGDQGEQAPDDRRLIEGLIRTYRVRLEKRLPVVRGMRLADARVLHGLTGAAGLP